MQEDSYSRAEVIAAGHTLPERGPTCHKCGSHIPIFEDLSEAEEDRIRECMENGSMVVMLELSKATGCSLEWAKLWVHHNGRAEEPSPCPYCGKPLRTSSSKQCRFCLNDWHDESKVVSLGLR